MATPAKQRSKAVETPEAMLKLRELFAAHKVVNTDDPEAMVAQMVERIFAAESPEDILNVQGTGAVHARDVLGVPFRVTDVEFRESDEGYMDGGVGVYAVMHATDLRDGTNTVVTCGSVNVCSALLALREREWLPQQVKLIQAKEPTARGYYPLWLVGLTAKETPGHADFDPSSVPSVAEEPF